MTQQISKADFDALQARENKLRKANPVTIAILAMGNGEAMRVEKAEWPLKVSLEHAIKGLSPRKKEGKTFEIKNLADDSGWAILRTS